mmetsp:Transcript_11493/g.70666  ORF Transcript_11493/g.70666 Transcript_11493/m.70666 type:complete len:198 (-) Transcript_11493:2133-2726(-)
MLPFLCAVHLLDDLIFLSQPGRWQPTAVCAFAAYRFASTGMRFMHVCVKFSLSARRASQRSSSQGRSAAPCKQRMAFIQGHEMGGHFHASPVLSLEPVGMECIPSLHHKKDGVGGDDGDSRHGFLARTQAVLHVCVVSWKLWPRCRTAGGDGREPIEQSLGGDGRGFPTCVGGVDFRRRGDGEWRSGDDTAVARRPS